MRGFTIIELVVAMAILVSFLALGIPKMHSMIERHHVYVDFHQVRKALTSARGIAQKESINVSLCPVKNKSCSSNWQQPLKAFHDRNTNNTIDDDEIVFFTSSMTSDYGYWQKSKESQNFVRFNALGHAFSSASTFLYCPYSVHKRLAKSIVISFQGRIRTASYLNRSGRPYSRFSRLNCGI